MLLLARLPGLLVTGALATGGSFALGFAVMTDCTNDYSCSSSACGPCAATNALLIGGWLLQGALFVLAVALFLPPVARRLRRPTLLALALAVPVVSVLSFAGVVWASDHSYCRPDQERRGREDYCHVEAGAPAVSSVLAVPLQPLHEGAQGLPVLAHQVERGRGVDDRLEAVRATQGQRLVPQQLDARVGGVEAAG